MKNSDKIFITFFIFLICSINVYSQEKLISKNKLIEDVKELLEIIETSHPDPYINGGGKIAFHRRFQDVLKAIPKKGLTIDQFYNKITPFLASIRDGHTGLFTNSQDNSTPGLPFRLKVIEKDLVLEKLPDRNYEIQVGVKKEKHLLSTDSGLNQYQKKLFGSRLFSVNDISLNELIKRQSMLRGAENEYTVMAFLLYSSFRTKEGLKRLIPEWDIEKPLQPKLSD